MVERENSMEREDDEISLKDLILNIQGWIKYLWSKWLIILVVGLLGGGIGLLLAINSKPIYIAKLNFVLEDSKSGGGLGGLGGLAGMAGVNLGGGGGGLFQGDNILELYKSRHMLTETLLSPSGIREKELLVDRYIAMNELREAWAGTAIEHINFDIAREKFTLHHDSLMGLFVNDIRKNILNVRKPDKILSLIEVEVKAVDESFSKLFTENLVQKVSSFYVDGRTQKSKENLNILQHQVDSVRRELNLAIGGVAASTDANPNANPARQVLRVGSAQRQVDVQANQAILTELVRSLELAKVSLRKDAPLIQIVDSPILPLEQEDLGKAKAIIVGGVIAGFLVLLILIGVKIYKDIMSSD